MGNLIAVYSNNDSDRFDVGELIFENEEEMLLVSYSNDGAIDGYIYLLKENIYRYENDSKYLKRIEKIIKPQPKKNQLELYNYYDYKSIIIPIINSIQNEKLFVTLTIIDSDEDQIVGVIRYNDDDFIEIEQYNYYGEYDGLSKLKKDAIIRIDINGNDEQLVKKLSTFNKE